MGLSHNEILYVVVAVVVVWWEFLQKWVKHWKNSSRKKTKCILLFLFMLFTCCLYCCSCFFLRISFLGLGQEQWELTDWHSNKRRELENQESITENLDACLEITLTGSRVLTWVFGLVVLWLWWEGGEEIFFCKIVSCCWCCKRWLSDSFLKLLGVMVS